MMPAVLATVIVLALVCAQLAWQYTHGGVIAHHLLARADLPSVSNWWNVLVLPALTYLAVARVEQRAAASEHAATRRRIRHAAIRWGLGPFMLGGTLALGFLLGAEHFTLVVFLCLFAGAVLFPVARAECALGLLLGMAWTFGTIIPLGIATVLATLSMAMHRLALPMLRRAWQRHA
jgi:hypothetical protein